MRLLEHEAKQILRRYELPVANGIVIGQSASTSDIPMPAVVKAQVPVGGRGKAGGVKTVGNHNELEKLSSQLIGSELLGHTVNSLLVEEALEIERELYLAIAIDRSTQSAVILAYPEGGVEIESATKAEGPVKLVIEDEINEKNITDTANALKLGEPVILEFGGILRNLWKLFKEQDAILVEINPLALTTEGKLVCADAKFELDDYAAFRHDDWNFETKTGSSQYVELNREGTVASMANGAGLAMATMDAIKAAGAEPANFLDIGGGTSAEGMTKAFETISQLPNVKALVINVFAGITRCDEVAKAIISAKEKIQNLPPMFIRLSGTNEAEAKKLLASENIPLLSSLDECVSLAVGEVS